MNKLAYTAICSIGILVVSTRAFAQTDHEDFRKLARSVSSPLFDSFEEASSAYQDGSVMLLNEMAYQAIGSWSSRYSNIEKVRANVYSELQSCHYSMRRIRTLDKSVPDFEILAAKGLMASPALVRRTDEKKLLEKDKEALGELLATAAAEFGSYALDKWKASNERKEYRKNYRTARRSGLLLENAISQMTTSRAPNVFGLGFNQDTNRADEKLVVNNFLENSSAPKSGMQIGDIILSVDGVPVTKSNFTACLSMTKGSIADVKVQRGERILNFKVPRNVFIYEGQLLQTEINSSWNAYFDSDYVYFTNTSGRDLTDVALYVTVSGWHGDEGTRNGDTHMHFVDHWPSGATKVARYMSTSARGIASDESVDQIDTLEYRLYSNEYTQERVVQYSQEQFDEDIQRYFDRYKIYGEWKSLEDNLFYDSGFMLTREKGYKFPCKRVTVTAYWGDWSYSYYRNMDDNHFPAGTEYSVYVWSEDRFFSGPKFERGRRPDRVRVVFEFPHTDFKITKHWNLK